MMRKQVIVIGAGLAGMVAAYAAQAEGAEVILIDRGLIGIGTNSALSNGVFAGPTSSYSPDDYVKDTLQIGKMINNELSVKVVAQQVLNAFKFLRYLGINLEESPGHYILKPSRPDVMRGVALVRKLAEEVRNLERVNILAGFYITEILREGNQLHGVKGFDKKGREVSICAPAVVMATGGAGAIYLRNDNQKTMMGQGYFLAAKAGLELWDMEFVQFYPLVIAEPHLPSLMLYPPYPREAKLISASGEDILRKYGIDDTYEAIRKKRDEFSAIVFEEGLAGPVYMDYRKIPSFLWEKYPLSLLKKIKFDFRTRPFAISPGAHFFIGGIRTDELAQTSLPGLFACGEVAWGLHGANRRGGNALTECVVFGRIAGRSAARYAFTHQESPSDTKELPNAPAPHLSPAQIRYRELRHLIRDIAWRYAGVVKSEQGLKVGLSKLEELDGELGETAPQTVSERKLRQDLMSAAFVLKAVLTASLARMESRGVFNRKDFPQEDNINWRKNSCLVYDLEGDDFSVSHHQVINPSLQNE
jgi:aspartate oxidase